METILQLFKEYFVGNVKDNNYRKFVYERINSKLSVISNKRKSSVKFNIPNISTLKLNTPNTDISKIPNIPNNIY